MKALILPIFMLLLLAAGCPSDSKDNDGNHSTSATATGDSQPDVTPLHEATEPDLLKPQTFSTTDPAELIRSMVRFLRDGDQENYTACFHPDSPRLEEMLWVFSDFRSGSRSVDLGSVSVEQTDEAHASATYSLIVTKLESGETETEEGVFGLVTSDAGNWVIWSVD